MALLDIDVQPLFAALTSDGSLLLELAIDDDGDDDDDDDRKLVKVTIPPSDISRRLAGETTQTLELDELPSVAPQLAAEIQEFLSELKHRLVTRAIQTGA